MMNNLSYRILHVADYVKVIIFIFTPDLEEIMTISIFGLPSNRGGAWDNEKRNRRFSHK